MTKLRDFRLYWVIKKMLVKGWQEMNFWNVAWWRLPN